MANHGDQHPQAPGFRSALASLPRKLPALARSLALGERAAAVGFDWRDVGPVLAKVDEELKELDQARASGPPAAVRAELGDLLFSVANVARKLGVDPEEALQEANAKFVRRFEFIEARLAASGRHPRQASLEEMDALWHEAKDDGL